MPRGFAPRQSFLKNAEVRRYCVSVLEVNRGYISNIENGKKNPTLATVAKIANALGVSADELLK
ncbi:MAG: hypothetical protein US76_04280 [Parcubacteria group bacterium GW2011_GWA2_38_13b]|nr:MAG: hypothetical protein US76_04280 [Parcubacteria group bacterium GW2011_GWA2_38_13b]